MPGENLQQRLHHAAQPRAGILGQEDRAHQPERDRDDHRDDRADEDRAPEQRHRAKGLAETSRADCASCGLQCRPVRKSTGETLRKNSPVSNSSEATMPIVVRIAISEAASSTSHDQPLDPGARGKSARTRVKPKPPPAKREQRDQRRADPVELRWAALDRPERACCACGLNAAAAGSAASWYASARSEVALHVHRRQAAPLPGSASTACMRPARATADAQTASTSSAGTDDPQRHIPAMIAGQRMQPLARRYSDAAGPRARRQASRQARAPECASRTRSRSVATERALLELRSASSGVMAWRSRHCRRERHQARSPCPAP